MRLVPGRYYLQIALNSSLSEAKTVINHLPVSPRIIMEAGTPLIKEYGAEAIRKIRNWWRQRIEMVHFTQQEEIKGKTFGFSYIFSNFLEPKNKQSFEKPYLPRDSFHPYVVADLKCMDRGAREVRIAQKYGAQAVTVLGQAPIETLDALIKKCQDSGLDAIVDMMNVNRAYRVLRQLKHLPKVVMLHRGVDETEMGNKPYPIHLINKIKGAFDVMISIGGGDTPREVQSAVFNGADIVMVWKDFYGTTGKTTRIAETFLKKIK